jgi:hypothetical protein
LVVATATGAELAVPPATDFVLVLAPGIEAMLVPEVVLTGATEYGLGTIPGAPFVLDVDV